MISPSHREQKTIQQKGGGSEGPGMRKGKFETRWVAATDPSGGGVVPGSG